MICFRSLLLQTGESASLPVFLPLVIAGFTTAFILGVQWFVGAVFHREQVSSNTNPSEKEHLRESSSFPPAA
jgi:hypothetical protein